MSGNPATRAHTLSEDKRKGPAPGFVVLRQLTDGQWLLLAEVPRRPGVTARAARSLAVKEASGGAAKAGDICGRAAQRVAARARLDAILRRLVRRPAVAAF